MSLPTYGSTSRPSKFGVKTKTFNIRLPPATINKIKEKKIDTGQIVYDVVEKGLNPYSNPTKLALDKGPELLKKMVNLMIDQQVVAPAGFFNETDVYAIQKIAKGELL